MISKCNTSLDDSNIFVNMSARGKRDSNFVAIYSYMNTFLSEEKYFDVTIKVENETFKSHRLLLAALSEYFDGMFGSGFQESQIGEKLITIQDENADAFKEVYRFLYTGEFTVNDSNVFNLLHLIDYLRLRVNSIEQECVTYLQNGHREGRVLPDALRIFIWACATNKPNLVALLSAHILKRLDIFLKDDMFKEMCFSDFNEILMNKKESSDVPEDVLLEAIIRWVHHRREERKEYVAKFIKMVDFAKVPVEYTKLLVSKYEDLMDCILSTTVRFITNAANSDESDDQATHSLKAICTDFDYNRVKVHAFIKYNNAFLPDERKAIYSATRVNNWTLSSEYESIYCSRRIAMNNMVYRLGYRYPCANGSVLESQRKIFSASHSIDTLPKSFLKNPPCLLSHDFGMCSTQSHIYLYNGSESSGNFNVAFCKSSPFTMKDFSQGIYGYNTELDEWFSVVHPILPQKFDHHTSMTADNDLLYVIGGSSTHAFDCRKKSWIKLPDPVWYPDAQACSSCVHRGKIYFTCSRTVRARARARGGSLSDCIGGRRITMQVYDPTAGKWGETMEKLIALSSNFPHPNQIWLVSDTKDLRVIGDIGPMLLLSNDSLTEKIEVSSFLYDTIKAASGSNALIFDVVVF